MLWHDVTSGICQLQVCHLSTSYDGVTCPPQDTPAQQCTPKDKRTMRGKTQIAVHNYRLPHAGAVARWALQVI